MQIINKPNKILICLTFLFWQDEKHEAAVKQEATKPS